MTFAYRALPVGTRDRTYTESPPVVVSVNDDPCLRSVSLEPPSDSRLWCPSLSASHGGHLSPEHGKLHGFLQKLARRRRGRQDKDKSLPGGLSYASYSTKSLNSIDSDQITLSSSSDNPSRRQRKGKSNRRRKNDVSRSTVGRRPASFIQIEGDELQRISMNSSLVQK